MMPYDNVTFVMRHLFLYNRYCHLGCTPKEEGEAMNEWEERYHRQIIAAEFDVEKQQILQESRILVVGLGGVGTAAALYLALAGVCNLGLCDHGLVEESNLHRQILYSPSDLGLRKVDAAAEVLIRQQPDLRPVTYLMDAKEGLPSLQDSYDLVLDCLDNSPARLAVARYARQHSLPSVSSGARDWSGFVAAFQPPRTACLGCLYGMPGRQEPYAGSGIMGPVAGAAGTWAAARAIQLLTQPQSLATAEYIAMDLWSGQLERLTLARRTDCPVCGVL
jgi:molybdopterin-synthase adenylyltransferase